MKHAILIATMLATSAVASAAPINQELENRLQGMTEVSDGLYAKVEGDKQSYFATNRAGQLAIADLMKKNNAIFAKIYALDGISEREQMLLDRSEQLQNSLRKPAAISKDYDQDSGNCSTGAALFAYAQSDAGRWASAGAQITLDFGPTTPTSNYALARTSFHVDESWTTGLTPAAAASNAPGSCFAEAMAYVACPPGYPGGAGPAYAMSGDPYAQCIEP